jgi:hypothetical protein
MNGQTSAGMNQKSGRVFGKLGHLAKTDVAIGRARKANAWTLFQIRHPLLAARSFPSERGPPALRKARISLNTLLRRPRSLFSRKVLRQLPLRLPSPLPFDGVEFEPRQSMKYRSNFNVLNLIKLANKELRPSDPSVYMISLLAVAAGLRSKGVSARKRIRYARSSVHSSLRHTGSTPPVRS